MSLNGGGGDTGAGGRAGGGDTGVGGGAGGGDTGTGGVNGCADTEECGGEFIFNVGAAITRPIFELLVRAFFDFLDFCLSRFFFWNSIHLI